MLSPAHTSASDQIQHESNSSPTNIDVSVQKNKEPDIGATFGGSQTGSQRRHRRHRNQASSSFRLESPSASVIRRSDAPPVISQSAIRAETHRFRTTSKHQPDDSELAIPKRKSHRIRNLKKSFVGNLPLAHDAASDISELEATPRSTTVESNPGSVSNPDTSTDPAPSQPHNQSSPGLDTDPAQIVNLALVLSESRRQGSSGRAVSAGVERNRRSASAALPNPKLRDSFSPPKYDESGPRDRGGRPLPEGDTGNQQQQIKPPALPETAIALRFGSNEYGPVDFSNATLGRARKAQKHFELFSEYLRLLPHLPPLGPPKDNYTQTDREAYMQGREYNPLQYIRNRKVRFRERCPIDSDAKGWGDVDKVKEWVDEVTTSHDLRSRQPNECLQLPVMEPPKEAADPGDPEKPGALQPSKSNVNETSRPRRPRKDWLVSPLDLLADAAWLETGSNKSKIEDCEGNKVFPVGTKFKAVRAPEQSALSEGSQSHNQLLRDEDTMQFTGDPSSSSYSAKRGRQMHQFNTIGRSKPTYNHHSGSATKSGRRKRSRDSSTSSESSNGRNGRWGKRLSRLGRKHSDQPEKTSFESNSPGLQGTSDAKKSSPGTAGTAHHSLLPPLDTGAGDAMPRSPRSGYATPPYVPDATNKEGTMRTSVDDMDTAQSSPVYDSRFPSMTANLSPLRGRSTSPSGRFTPIINNSRKWSKKKQVNGRSGKWFAPEDLASNHEASFSPIRQTQNQESRRAEGSPTKSSRTANQQESKVRGIFKGGRIAEIMGNEVSRVGEFIRKKDSPVHSRQPSYASSLTSEYIDTGDDPSEKKNGKTKLHSSNIFVNQDTSLQILESRKHDSRRYRPPGLPIFTLGRQSQDSLRPRRPTFVDSRQNSRSSLPKENNNGFQQSKLLDSPDISTAHSRDRGPFDQKFAKTPGSIQQARLSSVTRSWSISSHSIRPDFDIIIRREISRVRAHLLSSGIKALELCRHAAESPNFCVESWLKSRSSCDAFAPYIASSDDTLVKARSLVASFDHNSANVQQSLLNFSTSRVPELRSDIERLEHFAVTAITPRIRKATKDAEIMTSELATTNTLAIKELHDALDKGIRNRNRRLRWISRLGYVLLEWILVGVMWWAWMIVMFWKIIRSIWRGTVSGVRWVLWL